MRKYLVFAAIIFTLLLAACGKSDSTSGSKPANASTDKKETEETEVLKDATGKEIKFDKKPESFATLNTGDLNILTALEANVTGRPSTKSKLDENTAKIQEIGNPHQPNFEQIAKIKPDVLVAAPSFQRQAANVEKQGTKVVYTSANSVADITGAISMFGKILEKEDKADEINAGIEKRVDAAKAKQQGEKKRALLVYGAPGTFLVALPNSLSGDILKKAGGENIASDFKQDENYPQYAQLSVEKIIERNPEVVMLITHGDPSGVKEAFEKEMKQNAAWKNLDAVKNGNVSILPADLFGSNPGVKIADAIDEMQNQLSAVK